MGEYVDVLKGVLRVTLAPDSRGGTPQSEMTPRAVKRLRKELKAGLEALAIQGRGQLAEDICPHCQGPPTMWVIGGKCKPAVRCECKEGHSWVR
jgi:hypothetical protein